MPRKLCCRRRQGKSNTDTLPTPGCHRPSQRAKSAPGKYLLSRRRKFRSGARAYTCCNQEAKMEIRSTGNDHEPWTNLGSSSDDARRSIAPHCSCRQVLVLYLERPPDNSAQLHALRRALRIQRLEGSRPHGGLCTLNGSDRAQQVKPFALVGRICGFDGWIDGRAGR